METANTKQTKTRMTLEWNNILSSGWLWCWLYKRVIGAHELAARTSGIGRWHFGCSGWETEQWSSSGTVELWYLPFPPVSFSWGLIEHSIASPVAVSSSCWASYDIKAAWFYKHKVIEGEWRNHAAMRQSGRATASLRLLAHKMADEGSGLRSKTNEAWGWQHSVKSFGLSMFRSGRISPIYSSSFLEAANTQLQANVFRFNKLWAWPRPDSTNTSWVEIVSQLTGLRESQCSSQLADCYTIIHGWCLGTW